MNGFDVHASQGNLERVLARLDEDKTVCAENKKLILGFAKTHLAKGRGKRRVVKCVYTLRTLAQWFKKPFSHATKAQLIELVGELENAEYAHNTKYDFKVILKMFYKWLKGNDDVFPDEIRWLKPRMRAETHKLPEELLTEEEVFSIAGAADNPRDKALILVLYETGCRIGELLSLKMKNVIFDQYGAILRVTGKTGDRRVRIISSAPTLGAWVGVYANAKEPEAPLWPPLSTGYKNAMQPMAYGSVHVLISTLAHKAGIRKRVYPHLFRHSRATFLASKLTEAQMKEYFGWAQASDMAAVYVHLSGRDVDNALLALQGLTKPADKQEERLKVCSCPRCREMNSPIAKFCLRCGTPMQTQLVTRMEEERANGDGLLNRLMEDSEFKDVVYRKIVELGLENRLG